MGWTQPKKSPMFEDQGHPIRIGRRLMNGFHHSPEILNVPEFIVPQKSTMISMISPFWMLFFHIFFGKIKELHFFRMVFAHLFGMNSPRFRFSNPSPDPKPTRTATGHSLILLSEPLPDRSGGFGEVLNNPYITLWNYYIRVYYTYV